MKITGPRPKMYEDHWTRTKDVKYMGAPSRAPLSVLTISWRRASSPWLLPCGEGHRSHRQKGFFPTPPPASSCRWCERPFAQG